MIINSKHNRFVCGNIEPDLGHATSDRLQIWRKIKVVYAVILSTSNGIWFWALSSKQENKLA